MLWPIEPIHPSIIFIHTDLVFLYYGKIWFRLTLSVMSQSCDKANLAQILLYFSTLTRVFVFIELL